jgi:hypothetical protein
MNLDSIGVNGSQLLYAFAIEKQLVLRKFFSLKRMLQPYRLKQKFLLRENFYSLFNDNILLLSQQLKSY